MRQLASDGDPDAQALLQSLGLATQSAQGSTTISKAQRLAVCLGVVDDIGQAAELAGLDDLDPPELADLEKLAREKHADLVARKLTAIGSMATATMLLSMLRLRDVAPVLPAAQVQSSIKTAADVLERLTGGLAPTYSEITVNLKLD